MSGAALAGLIDHTQLKPEASKAQIEQLCAEAKELKTCSVCVNPCWIPLCAQLLKGSGVKVCTVIGFPLGANDPAVKAFEAAKAVENGADEVDMVLAIGHMRDGDYKYVEDDIRGVVKAAKEAGQKKGADIVTKVIFETALLTNEQIKDACELSKSAGADFVKTSTGFSTGGATVEHITLMRQTVGPDVGVKASGGIRDYATAQAMVDAGANRLGCSSGKAIVAGGSAGGSGY